MKILSLRLSGPLQAWGSSSRYSKRRTEKFPTKSGMVGLLASAMGIRREETEKLADSGLLDIDLAVRIDRPGNLISDYHTVAFATSAKNSTTKLSDREYLTDAVFLVGIMAPAHEDLLERLADAVANPRYALFLGRKSCVPDHPLLMGLQEYGTVDEFLEGHPLLLNEDQVAKHGNKPLLSFVTVQTSTAADASTIQDNPTSFSSHRRLYKPRFIVEGKVEVPNPYYIEPQVEDNNIEAEANNVDMLDPFALLRSET